MTVEDIELAARELPVGGAPEAVHHAWNGNRPGQDEQRQRAHHHGRSALGSPGAVGTTTFRPPYLPIRLGLLSGRHIDKHFSAVRVSPMHEWHVRNGAVMGPANLWLRPKAYLRGNRSYAQAWQRECRNVRQDVGIVDVSTLGKIEVQGPDAGVFLDRVCANRISTLKVGKGAVWRAAQRGRNRLRRRHHRPLGESGCSSCRRRRPMRRRDVSLRVSVGDRMAHVAGRVTSVTDHYAQIALAGAQEP